MTNTTITCLNLCDIFQNDYINEILNIVQNDYTFNRIYVGSYFCESYFINAKYEKIMQILVDNFGTEIKITLVVPIPTEKYLSKVKAKISALIQKYNNYIDEITINDYGNLEYIYNEFKKKINLGRLFFKDYRDPRYIEYFENTWIPKFYTQYIRNIIKKYNINEIEIDVTHKEIDISNIENTIIGIHTPYTYITTGKICEYASINKQITEKFRPGCSCNVECNEMSILYEMNDNIEWIKLGKTVFFENNCFKIININETDNRIIFFPLNTIVAYKKNKLFKGGTK